MLRCCSEFVETHGIVDGIYRLSGVSSNIQKLRYASRVAHPPCVRQRVDPSVFSPTAAATTTTTRRPRGEFESDGSPDLNKDVFLQDIHCVSSLCKAYFRELPNPLLTYQLYDKFAVSSSCTSLHPAPPALFQGHSVTLEQCR